MVCPSIRRDVAECRGCYLSKIKTGAVSTVVVVSVHVKDFLALDGEQSREDTFG